MVKNMEAGLGRMGFLSRAFMQVKSELLVKLPLQEHVRMGSRALTVKVAEHGLVASLDDSGMLCRRSIPNGKNRSAVSIEVLNSAVAVDRSPISAAKVNLLDRRQHRDFPVDASDILLAFGIPIQDLSLRTVYPT